MVEQNDNSARGVGKVNMKDEQNYPWRDSLTDKARCACCQHYHEIPPTNEELAESEGQAGYTYGCSKGRELVYPLFAQEHDCPDFIFKPAAQIFPTPFNQCEYAECATCGHNLNSVCDGKQWLPVRIKEGKCEFWNDANLTCRYAIPYHQYIGGYRNNYCRLEPAKRDGDAKQGWKWNCTCAHYKWANQLKCYEPIKQDGSPAPPPPVEAIKP